MRPIYTRDWRTDSEGAGWPFHSQKKWRDIVSRTSRIVMAVMVTAAASSSAIVGVAGNLTEADTAHLIFMRSEEKLARDVYLTIAEMYPDQPIFLTIATRAEQTHTDTMARMLKKFKIPDPEHSTELDTLPPPEQIGVFENYYFLNNYLYWADEHHLTKTGAEIFTKKISSRPAQYSDNRH